MRPIQQRQRPVVIERVVEARPRVIQRVVQVYLHQFFPEILISASPSTCRCSASTCTSASHSETTSTESYCRGKIGSSNPKSSASSSKWLSNFEHSCIFSLCARDHREPSNMSRLEIIKTAHSATLLASILPTDASKP